MINILYLGMAHEEQVCQWQCNLIWTCAHTAVLVSSADNSYHDAWHHYEPTSCDCHVTSCDMWHHVTDCDIMWQTCDIMWHHVMSCGIMWHHVTCDRHVTSCDMWQTCALWLCSPLQGTSWAVDSCKIWEKRVYSRSTSSSLSWRSVHFRPHYNISIQCQTWNWRQNTHLGNGGEGGGGREDLYKSFPKFVIWIFAAQF